jgi:uncharacterized protein (TIGR03790 family)
MARGDGSEVAVVYSKQIPASKEVALHYAAKRGVPASQLIEIDTPAAEQVSRAVYRDQIERPIHRALVDRGLFTDVVDIVAATAERPGTVRHRCVGARIRYLVMCWGLPYRIAPDPALPDDAPKEYRQPNKSSRNEACVDNELCLLPGLGNFYLSFVVPNRWAFGATNAAQIHPTNAVLMVTRLDGPTPELAAALVDKAMQAEADGLWGRAYVDLRSITDPGYAQGDAWMTNAAKAVKLAGFETYMDFQPQTLPPAFPLSHVAVYAGWYDGSANGPFLAKHVEFMTGAIAYHLHSFSAQQLRNPTITWAGPMIAKGATATLGCTDEPYLHLTPEIGVFLDRLVNHGFTLGEAGYASLVALSWQTVIVGDPLYRPGAKSPAQWVEELTARHSTNLEWAILQKVNHAIATGADSEKERRYLLDHPLTANSSVLQEKLATMALSVGQPGEAVKSYQRALDLPGSPMQRTRLFLELAGWQTNLRRRDEAWTTYQRFLKELPEYPDLLELRRRQLALAKDLKRKDDIAFLEAEVKRLTPSPEKK